MGLPSSEVVFGTGPGWSAKRMSRKVFVISKRASSMMDGNSEVREYQERGEVILSDSWELLRSCVRRKILRRTGRDAAGRR